MPLLDVIQEFALRTGIPKPLSAVNSSDAQIAQLVALANEVASEVSVRGEWGHFTREAVITTIAAESQGKLITLLSDGGYKWVIPGTFFNRTLHLPMYGPISRHQWQALKAIPATGPLYKYRIRTGELLINPVPPAGHVLALEYATSWIITNATLTAYYPRFTDDAQLFALGDDILLAGLRWKWKAEKGLDYAQEFATFEALCVNMLALEKSAPTLNMADGEPDYRPGIFVPAGNWTP